MRTFDDLLEEVVLIPPRVALTCREQVRRKSPASILSLDFGRLTMAGALEPGHVGFLKWGANGLVALALYFVSRHGTSDLPAVTIHDLTPVWDGRSGAEHARIELTIAAGFGQRGRYWFTCPISGCGRRCLRLFSEPDSAQFRCRTCFFHARRPGRHDVVVRLSGVTHHKVTDDDDTLRS